MNKPTRKPAALSMVVLLVVISLLAGSCGTQPPPSPTSAVPTTAPTAPSSTLPTQAPTKPPDTGATGQLVMVTIGLDSARNLHPSQTGFEINHAIASHIMEGLLGFSSNDLTLYPRLATEMRISPDGLVLTFPLRPNVKFHNGDPLTAEDVKYSLDFIINDPAGANTYKANFSEAVFEGIYVIDPLIVEVRLKQPSIAILQALARMYIAPKRLLEQEPDSLKNPLNRMPIGTGPYKIVSHEGDDIELEWNPDYWGEKAKIAKIYFKSTKDVNAVAAAMLSGESDIAVYDPIVMEGLETRAGLTLLRSPSNVICTFRWTLANPIFADKNFRHALSYGMDRVAMVQGGMNGWGEPTGQPLPSNSPLHNPNIKAPLRDAEMATSLFTEAGWTKNTQGVLEKDGQALSFEVGVYRKVDEDMALVLQQNWKPLGVDMSIRMLADFATFREYATTGAPLMICSGLGADPGPLLPIYYGTGHWGVRWTTPHDDVIKQIEASNAELDDAKRTELVWNLMTFLADLMPEIYIANPVVGLIHKPELKGVFLNQGPGQTGWMLHMEEWYWEK